MKRYLADAHRLSSAILLLRIRARLGLMVRPCDLQKILRRGDNAYKLLDRLVERKFATRTRTIDVGKGTLLYTLAEDHLRVCPPTRAKKVHLRWKVALTFVPGYPPTTAYSLFKPAAGLTSLVRLRRMRAGKEVCEYYVVRFRGTLPDGWLVQLEDDRPKPTHRRVRRRRRKT